MKLLFFVKSVTASKPAQATPETYNAILVPVAAPQDADAINSKMFQAPIKVGQTPGSLALNGLLASVGEKLKVGSVVELDLAIVTP